MTQETSEMRRETDDRTVRVTPYPGGDAFVTLGADPVDAEIYLTSDEREALTDLLTDFRETNVQGDQ